MSIRSIILRLISVSVSIAMIRNSDAERLVDKDVAGVRQKVEMAKEIAEGRSAFRSLVAMSVKYEKASKVDPLFDFVQSNIKQRRLEKNREKKVSNLVHYYVNYNIN